MFVIAWAVVTVLSGLAAYALGWLLGMKDGHEKGKLDADARLTNKVLALQLALRQERARPRPWILEAPREIRAKTGPARMIPPQPAPLLLGASDTGTFRRLSDTGEIRAIQAKGDELVAAIKEGRI